MTLTERQATEVALALVQHGYLAGFEAVREGSGRVVPDAFTIDTLEPFPEG